MSEITELAGASPVPSPESLPDASPPVRQPDPPPVLDIGTILTLRKAGHLRSPVPGQEYFAPAVVLEQYMPAGEIDALVWDASAGAHFVSAYPIRDVDARTDNAGRREMYVRRSNIGDILFSPAAFKSIEDGMDTLAIGHSRMRAALGEQHTTLESLLARVESLETFRKQFDLQSNSSTDALSGRTGAQPAEATHDSLSGGRAEATRDLSKGTPKGGPNAKS